MPPKKMIEAVRPQVLPRSQDQIEQGYKQMIARLVEERIAEVLAGSQAQDLEPFFQPKDVSDEMKRRATVTDNRKWVYYYETWGCLICDDRKAGHRGLGMCHTCFNRTRNRILEIKREHAPGEVPEIRSKQNVDLARNALSQTKQLPDEVGRLDPERMAREALMPSLKKLARKRKTE